MSQFLSQLFSHLPNYRSEATLEELCREVFEFLLPFSTVLELSKDIKYSCVFYSIAHLRIFLTSCDSQYSNDTNQSWIDRNRIFTAHFIDHNTSYGENNNQCIQYIPSAKSTDKFHRTESTSNITSYLS